MPNGGLLGVNAGRRGPFTQAQASMLIGAQEAPELEVVVAREALKPAPEIAPQQGHAADHHRVSGQAVDRDRQVVEGRGAHEVLPKPDPKPPCPDALMAGALRAQVNETDQLDVDALCDPAEHARPMAI